MTRSRGPSRAQRLLATAVGAVLGAGLMAASAAAISAGLGEEFDTDDTPGAVLEVEQISSEQIEQARIAAESDPKLRAVLRKSNVADVSPAPIYESDGSGTLTGVLLTYQLEGPFRGPPDFVRLPAQAGVANKSFGLVVRSATRIDITVDLDGAVLSALPGFGTEYEEPVVGDSITLNDGTEFVFEEGNFVYHEDQGAIELLGIGESSDH